jgi:transcriptional regulator with XRE-family HTH domain
MQKKPPLLVAIGTAVRLLRKKRGISQEDLAEAAGLHRTYVGMIERGEKNITVLSATRIARALGVSLSSLIKASETKR